MSNRWPSSKRRAAGSRIRGVLCLAPSNGRDSFWSTAKVPPKHCVLVPPSLLHQSYDRVVLKAHHLLHSEISSMDGCNFCLIQKGSLEKGNAKASRSITSSGQRLWTRRATRNLVSHSAWCPCKTENTLYVEEPGFECDRSDLVEWHPRSLKKSGQNRPAKDCANLRACYT